ncbi:Microtubule-binding protein MIP-T3 [Parelaphostrongylus tenuis]|uniref:Microtubule-binding protein MIP-T3 n=1 Tax=Parelaphostrongylus tenuis TaxID=148309 RepID=A0AAD5M878_PARTN|nr:Microtubule-binding protein MIP-T3 [Parelaphostrongylus tenuis]
MLEVNYYDNKLWLDKEKNEYVKIFEVAPQMLHQGISKERLRMVNTETTRTAFLGLIDKPPLTDQLLSRPPFRFILDIVKSTISRTGYLKDRFSPDDLNPSKFNDKNSKLAFLESLVQTINDGSLDDVKPSKIVAGKEPELTNLHTEEDEKETGEKKKRSKSKDRESHDKSDSKKGTEERKREKSKSVEKRKREGDEKNRDINSNHVKHQIEQEVDERNSAQQANLKDSGDRQLHMPTEDNEVTEIDAGLRPTVQERLPSATARPQTSLGRPGTAAARPPPPRLKRKQIAAVEETSVAPTQQVPELISESAPPPPSETFLVEDDEELEKLAPDDSRPSEVPGAINEQGGLVRKIIDTTAEFEMGMLNEAAEIDQGEFAKEKAKSEALLNALQEVTRTANPLSRIFDFAQEDLESMLKELEKWRIETKKYETLLEDKEAQGIGETQKLWQILNRLDEEIKDLRSSVTAAKARVIANNDRINEMLNNI